MNFLHKGTPGYPNGPIKVTETVVVFRLFGYEFEICKVIEEGGQEVIRRAQIADHQKRQGLE